VEKALIDSLAKEERTIKNLRNSLRKLDKIEVNSFSNLLKLKGELSVVDKLLNQTRLENTIKEEINRLVEDIKAKIPDLEEKLKGKFGHELDIALQEVGKEYNFKLKGHYPELRVLFYTLELRLENSGGVVIWYGPKQERLALVKPEPKTIAQKLKTIHESITKRKFDEPEFLSTLLEAYKMAAYREKKNFGEQIPINKVLLDFAFLIQDNKFKIDPTKKNYKDYGRVYFSYDLFRLKERRINSYELQLVTATRAYTQRRRDFLWIPSNEEGGGSYFSHIKFRRL